MQTTSYKNYFDDRHSTPCDSDEKHADICQQSNRIAIAVQSGWSSDAVCSSIDAGKKCINNNDCEGLCLRKDSRDHTVAYNYSNKKNDLKFLVKSSYL